MSDELPRRKTFQDYRDAGATVERATLLACRLCDVDGWLWDRERLAVGERVRAYPKARCDHGVKPAPPTEPVVDPSEPRHAPNTPEQESR